MLKPPIYMLPQGIKVVAEYPAIGLNPYVRLRIRPHPLFPDLKSAGNGCITRRSRIVMTLKLGRPLLETEYVHHIDENKTNDATENLELITPAEHNRHHKIGSRHTEISKEKISSGLRLAILEGRRKPPVPPDWTGRFHSEQSKKNMSDGHKAAIASGAIKKPIPPSWKGNKHSAASIEKIRQAKLAYWSSRKGHAL